MLVIHLRKELKQSAFTGEREKLASSVMTFRACPAVLNPSPAIRRTALSVLSAATAAAPTHLPISSRM